MTAIVDQYLEYPVDCPAEPPTLRIHPSVEPVEVSIDVPVLELPYYRGRWRFLNRFVDAAHTKPRAAYDEAVKQRELLLVWHNKFNDDASKANAGARRRWESAVAKQKKISATLRGTWEEDKTAYELVTHQEKTFLDRLTRAYQAGTKEGVEKYIDLALNELDLPKASSYWGFCNSTVINLGLTSRKRNACRSCSDRLLGLPESRRRQDYRFGVPGGVHA